MNEKIRISSVSYTNMLPFIYGLENSGIIDSIDLTFDVPSACATKLIEGQADIGIVPVAALLELPHYEIISDYCLGADGEVDSVFIFSEKPISEISSLRLDDQSRTSNGLARLLLSQFWGRNDVQILREGEADALVQIGDRTFGQKHKYKYYYDLAHYWKEFSGLPFTFAVWISISPLTAEFKVAFNQALAYGLENREIVIAQLPTREDFDYGKYLRKNIDYVFDESKRQAMDKYLAWMKAGQDELQMI